MSDVTRILDRVQQGDPKAADELLPLVYQDLRKLAAARIADESPDRTLQPTALVHEAWMRLVGNQSSSSLSPSPESSRPSCALQARQAKPPKLNPSRMNSNGNYTGG